MKNIPIRIGILTSVLLLVLALCCQQRVEAQWSSINSLEAEVFVQVGNGFGSTNTIVRRFSTVIINVGTAITYTDDSVYGASFLINVPGVYSISYTDQRTDDAFSGYLYYIDVDHAPVQSTVSAITGSGLTYGSIATSSPTMIGKNNITLLLDKGDVIRPWWFGNSGGTYNDSQSQFIVTKVR